MRPLSSQRLRRCAALPCYRSRHATTSPDPSLPDGSHLPRTPCSLYLHEKPVFFFFNTCMHAASVQTNRGTVKRQVQSQSGTKAPTAQHRLCTESEPGAGQTRVV